MRGLLVIALLALLTSHLGCASDPNRGYSFASTYDAGVETVSVPIFENMTHSTGLEAWLTDAIVKEIQSKTPWRVTSSERADTVLRGAIQDVRLSRLSRSPSTGLSLEQPLSLSVDFEWTDGRTGEVLVSRQSFRATSVFVPTRGVEGEPGERIEIGQRDAVAELAQAIVQELRSNW